MKMAKRQFKTITSFNKYEIIENFVNYELDLYVQLRNISGWINFKNDIGIATMYFSGYAKLTDNYRNWDIFQISPGNFILEDALEIIEPQKIFIEQQLQTAEDFLSHSWESKKKTIFSYPVYIQILTRHCKK